jgi:hypothetical protein
VAVKSCFWCQLTERDRGLRRGSELTVCCAVLCCAVLCCAVLCCAVLCCAVLCCACAVLCRSNGHARACYRPRMAGIDGEGGLSSRQKLQLVERPSAVDITSCCCCYCCASSSGNSSHSDCTCRARPRQCLRRRRRPRVSGSALRCSGRFGSQRPRGARCSGACTAGAPTWHMFA